VCVQAAFGSNTKVRMTSRETCNLLSKNTRRPKSQPYFLSTTNCYFFYVKVYQGINNFSNYK